jgi:hypothetical protein
LKPIDATWHLRVPLWSANQRATEAEESPVLKFINRKHCRKIAIWESCYQVKTSESRLRRQCGVICSVEVGNSVIGVYSYDLQAVNKSIHQSIPRL